MTTATEKKPRRKAEPQLVETIATGDLLAEFPPQGAHKPGANLATLPPAARAEVALESSKTEKHLLELVAKSADITEVNNADGREQAHRIAMVLKNARVTIKNTAEAAREDATAFSKAVIAEEKRLITITKAEEDRIFALRDAYDARVAAEKAEAERIAVERKAGIRAKIDAVASLPRTLAGESSVRLVEELQKLVAMRPTEDEFDGLLAEMLLTVETVGSALSALLAGAREREEIERQRIASQEAESARVAAQAAENERIAADLARQKAEAEAAAKVQADEMARLKAEIERERAELEAMREAMKPKPEPVAAPEPAPEVSEPQCAAFGLVQSGSHAPLFDWETLDAPPAQLVAIAITPPAVEPVETLPARVNMSMAVGSFFDAVRDLRQHRTAEEVRNHLEVVLADVQAEIGKGVKGYK